MAALVLWAWYDISGKNPAPEPTPQNFKRVESGMSVDNVRKVMGKETDLLTFSPGNCLMKWEHDGNYYYVEVKQGSAADKAATADK